MRRFLAATAAVGGLIALVAYALLTTLRAEARGPLGVNGASLLDIGSLQMRVELVSAGGTVANILPDGIVVQDRHRHLLRIYYAPHAVFLQRGVIVGQGAVELGAHVTALGVRGTTAFSAYKVRISPHHRAIGGLIALKLSANLFTVVNHQGAMRLVKVLPGAPITLRGRPTHLPLRPNVHIVVLAVRDPQQPAVYLADAVHVLLPPTSFRGGGLITRIDESHNIITIYNKTLNLVYTIEVKSSTKITLSRWSAGYGDMHPGDHLTVSGTTDPTNTAIGPNPIVAKRIRISSLNFGGTITAIAPAQMGGVVLTVRAHHGHMLQIDAPSQAVVSYGVQGQSAHVLDLLAGERISARGSRVGKFELVATFIHVYPHQYTVGGTVAAVLPGLYRIVNPANGKQFLIHVTLHTSYTLNGKPTTAAMVTPGVHIRVHGYDALHNDQKSIPTVIATHVSVIPHHVRQHRVQKKRSTKHAKATIRKAPGSATVPAGAPGARRVKARHTGV